MAWTNDRKITWTQQWEEHSSLSIVGSRALINKVASNQSWKGVRQPAHAKGIHEIDSVDMLVAKMDLLMKKLESSHQEVNHSMKSWMTCDNLGTRANLARLLKRM